MERLSAAVLAALERGGTIVTADPHQAYQIRLAWAERQEAAGRDSWASPDVLPLGAALSRAWTNALVDGAVELPSLLSIHQERALWEQILRERSGARQFLQPHGTARAAMRAWRRLQEWMIDPVAVAASPIDEAATFAQWARAFQERCDTGRWLDPASALHVMPGRVSRSPWIFTGFDSPVPSVGKLVQRLRSSGTDAQFCAGPTLEGHAWCAPFADSQAESRAAASWARERLLRNPHQRLLVVIPELDHERERIERTFDEILRPHFLLNGAVADTVPFAIEGGLPLARYPLVAAALTAVAMVSEPQPFDVVSAWFRSPYVMPPHVRSADRARLDLELRRSAAHELDMRACARALERAARRLSIQDPLIGAATLFQQALAGSHGLAQWSSNLSKGLRLLGWPGDSHRDSAQQQTLDKFNDALAELAMLDDIVGPVDARGMLHHLRAVAEQTRFQPETADAPVTVSGRLVDPPLAVDGLWVAGLHANAWPRAPRSDPFLPWELQRAAGIPEASAEGTLAQAQRLTARWMTSAPEVILSWPERIGDQACLRSPLLADLPLYAGDRSLGAAAHGYWRRVRDSAQLEQFEDAQAPPLSAAAPMAGGATAITLQSLCPIRAFADRRLGAQPLDRPEPGIDARTRGTLVHKALALLWDELETQERLLAMPPFARRKLIESVVARASALHLEKPPRWPARLVQLENQRLAALLHDWLDLEAKRAPFRAVAREFSLPAAIAGHPLELRIDRIDELPDGRRLLLDYKTGSSTPAAWFGNRPEDAQLPLYAVVLEPAPDGLAIAQLRAGDCTLRGVSSRPRMLDGDELEGWTAQLAAWRETVGRLAQGFARGDARVDPRQGPQTCRTCHLHSFCRIDEIMAAVIEDEETEDDG